MTASKRTRTSGEQSKRAETSISSVAWTRDARLPLRLHYLALAAGAVALLYFNRDQWFAADEWSFIPQRGEPGFRPGIFVPHNEHWVTIPVVIYRALFSLFGARSYLPYIAVLVALHLVATHLLYRVIRRTKATAWMALGLSSVFLTLGAGSENLLWAFQIGFVGSFAFGLLFILLVDRSSPVGPRDRVAWIAAIAAMMCSGVGLTMVLIAAIAVLLRRGARTSLLVCGPPIAAYAVWFAIVGQDGVNTDTPITRDTFMHMPAFIWNGTAATLEGMSGFSGSGPALVLMLVAVVALRAWGGDGQCLPLALGAGALILFFTAGLARIPENGPSFFDAPRYIYLASGLLIPLVALALSALPPRSIGRVAILPLTLVFVIAHGLSTLERSANETAAQAQLTRRSILAQAELIRSGETVLRGEQRARIFVRPDAVRAPGLTLTELVEMVENDQLPKGETLTESDRLGAISSLQVSLRRKPEVTPSATARPTIIGQTSVAAEPDGDACISVAATGANPELAVLVPAPTSLSLRFAKDAELSVLLERDNVVAPSSRSFSVRADTPTNINFASKNLIAHLSFVTDDRLVICGLDST